MEFHPGDLVLADAGREQSELFFVLGQSADRLLLVNGKHRTCSAPKRKSPKHVHPVPLGEFDHPILPKLREGTPVTDRELRKALAAFKEGITLG